SQLASAELDRVAEITRERSYPRNSVILFEDDPGDALYVVATGQVKVVLIGEDGREVILSVLGEGDFFGEMSLIDEEPRSAQMIGSSRETVSRTMRELVDKGFIEISRREILIRDRAALEASAGRS